MHLVRRARLSDAAAIAGVHVRSWQHAAREFVAAPYLASLSVEEQARAWAEAIEKRTQRIRVVERGDKPIGFASFGLSRDDGAGPTDFEVREICIEPAVIGTGAGFGLWVKCLAEMRLAGATRITMWVLEKDIMSIRFYKAAGFELDEAARRQVELGGAAFDEVRYVQAIRR
jgi:ribosomal protein S18 acetylase RimI-like enzyme